MKFKQAKANRYHVFFSNVSQILLTLSATLCLSLLLSGCAYRMGRPDRNLPMGYKQMIIPIFKNLSQETSAEVSFTNALIREFERSKAAYITQPSQAEVVIEGVIKSINYSGSGQRESKTDLEMPKGTVMASSYTITVVVSVAVRRLSDREVLWSGEFSRGRSYDAPQVTLAGINTVNPLYNLSARRQNLDVLANDLMAEAHDRITENF